MDPIRNPYAPGAGQRPPELAGRDVQLAAFDVVLERVAKGRPERSLVLTGLRGVGKTVLLNALRSAAVRRGWGTGKLEALGPSAVCDAVQPAASAASATVANNLMVRPFPDNYANRARAIRQPSAPLTNSVASTRSSRRRCLPWPWKRAICSSVVSPVKAVSISTFTGR